MHKEEFEEDRNLWYVAALFDCKSYLFEVIEIFLNNLWPRLWFQNTFEKIKKL